MKPRFFHSSDSARHVMGCLFCLWLFSGCMTTGFHTPGPGDLEKYIPLQIDAPVDGVETFEFTQQNPPDPVTAPAGQAKDLTLSVEQAVMLALAHNQDLKTRQLVPVIAGAFEQMEKGRYDPELFAQMYVSKEALSPTDSGDTAVSAAGGIRKATPWGTTLGVEMAHEQNNTPRTGDTDKTRVTLSVTQALLQGAGPAGGLVAIRQSELETRASIHELTAFVQALAAETEIAYWQYVLARQEHAIVERSLAVTKKQMADIQHQIAVGVLPRNELAAIQSEMARREQALIESGNQVEAFRLTLLYLIDPGDPGHLDRQVVPASTPVIDPDPVSDIDDRTKLAIKLRPDLAEAQLRMQQQRLETIVTYNGLLPRLDFFLDLGIAGFSRRTSDVLQSLDDKDLELFAGLSLSRFIGNRPARARHQAALATSQQARLALENLERTIRLDIRLAVNEIERSRQQIHASGITRRSEEQTVQAEIERFNVGASTALLVAQAQRDLLVSQIAEVRATINYRIALIRLFLAEGSLLARRGIVFNE
ncbi:MAG: TolC family protein [Desulfotignum sp.]|nr:TolC family protein [Desulfotignum sp.]